MCFAFKPRRAISFRERLSLIANWRKLKFSWAIFQLEKFFKPFFLSSSLSSSSSLSCWLSKRSRNRTTASCWCLKVLLNFRISCDNFSELSIYKYHPPLVFLRCNYEFQLWLFLDLVGESSSSKKFHELWWNSRNSILPSWFLAVLSSQSSNLLIVRVHWRENCTIINFFCMQFTRNIFGLTLPSFHLRVS